MVVLQIYKPEIFACFLLAVSNASDTNSLWWWCVCVCAVDFGQFQKITGQQIQMLDELAKDVEGEKKKASSENEVGVGFFNIHLKSCQNFGYLIFDNNGSTLLHLLSYLIRRLEQNSC